MNLKIFTIGLLCLLMTAPFSWAQERSLNSVVDYRVNKMKKELKLTDKQADSIRPLLRDYLSQRQAILQDAQDQGIIDHRAEKLTLKTLKDKEEEQLSKILSPEQMEKWKNKDKLMASLNPDNGASAQEDDMNLTPEGANFKF